MSEKILSLPRDLSALWGLLPAQGKQRTAETIIEDLCTDPSGEIYDFVKIKGAFGFSDIVVISAPELAHAVFVSTDIDKDVRGVRFVSGTGEQGLISSVGAPWMRMKTQFMSHVRGPIIENTFAKIENEIVDRLVEALDQRLLSAGGGTAILPDMIFKQMSFDAINREMGFDLPAELIHDFTTLLVKGFKSITSVAGVLSVFLGTEGPVLYKDPDNAEIIRRGNVAYGQSVGNAQYNISTRYLQAPEAFRANNFFEELVFYYMQAFAADKQVSVAEVAHRLLHDIGFNNEFSQQYANKIKEEASHIIVGGHDTTANLLSWAIHRLARSPDLQKRLQEALEGTEDESPSARSIMEGPLFKGFVSEMLRLYPALPLSMPRMVQNDTRIKYEVQGEERELFLKKGSLLALPIFLYQKNPRFFEEPEVFNIDRNYRSVAYMPFGKGQNLCPGRNVAFNRIAIAISKLIKNYDFSLPEGASQEMPARTMTGGVLLSPEPSAAVQIRKRNPALSRALATAPAVAVYQ